MISTGSEQNGLSGEQAPRISRVPRSRRSVADDALSLAESAGVYLDPWQELVIRGAMGERRDGAWTAFEVGVNCPRQNGKNEILLVRELAGLFLLDERLIIHSAHQFDTSLEAFRRIRDVIEANPKLLRRLARRGIKSSHGEEGVELKGNRRLRFRTRTKGGGRGFTADCLILDEAMDIPEAMHGALLPTLSARPNPQVWYTGSAVDQWVHENGVVFARIRERGLLGDDPRLAYFEWSVGHDNPATIGDLADERREWARANPGLGIRIAAEHIANERRSMDLRTFAVERLGVGDWPDPHEEESPVIPTEVWTALGDTTSRIDSDLVLAFDVTPDRSTSCIAAAGRRADGAPHVEIIEHERGTAWVAERIRDLKAKHRPKKIRCDGSGPAGSLLADLETDVEVEAVTPGDHAKSCGAIYDAALSGALRHREQLALNSAVRGARKRDLGEAWAWSRKSSSIDISPLVAATLAFGAIHSKAKGGAPLVGVVSR